MKIKNYNIVLFIFLFSLGTCFSQEEDRFSDIFKSKDNSLYQLSKVSNSANSNASLSTTSIVYVQQIGNNNNALADVKSSNVDVKLNQQGDKNFIFLDKSGLEINQLIAQDGNNNSVTDFNYKFKDAINSNYSQTGNNLNIVSIGTNSISNELIVKQKGNSGSVIILNK